MASNSTDSDSENVQVRRDLYYTCDAIDWVCILDLVTRRPDDSPGDHKPVRWEINRMFNACIPQDIQLIFVLKAFRYP